MRESLQLDSFEDGATTVLTVGGELDCSTAPLLSDLVEDSVERHPARLLLDLSGCSFLDSGGCRALAVARRLIGDGNIGVACPEANRSVRRVLEIVGLTEALDVRERLDDFALTDRHDLTA